MPRLDDGHSTTLTFSMDPSVEFWEVRLTPPGLDAGGVNDLTNMRTVLWRQRSPKKLITLTAMSGTAFWDPVVFSSLVTMLGKNQQITFNFSDGSELLFWGWLDKFVPGEAREGSPVEASFTVEPSNHDNANPFAEVGPSYTAP